MGNYGVHRKRELTALGFDTSAINRALTAGDLERLRHDWYAERLHELDVAAAVRAGGVLGCVSALKLYGLWVPPGNTGLHVRFGKALRGGGKRVGCRPIRGRPLPTPAAVDPIVYALACAARCMSEEDWIAVCDSYLFLKSVSVDELRVEIAPYGGATVDAMLDKVDGRSQSGTESIARVRLRALGFDVVVQPDVDYRIYEGHPDLRVGKLLIECDGEKFHSQEKDRVNDYTRDRKALIEGWESMRVAYCQVIDKAAWDEFVEDVRAFARADRHRVRSQRSKDALQRSREIGDSQGY